ncbi:MAG TPA: TolC family protein [Armatimonadota bacterium]|jgi:outer membrane protein TolC
MRKVKNCQRLVLGGLALIALAASSAGAAPRTGYAPPLPAGVDLSKALTLNDCVQIALRQSPTLAATADQIIQAQAGVTQARAALLPALSLNWDVIASKPLPSSNSTTFGSSGQRTTRDLFLQLSQTFYQGGLPEQIGAAQASATASRWALQDSRRLLVLSVAISYYNELAAAGLAEVAQRAVKTSTQHLDAANARIEAGTAARSDRFQFEVELQTALVAAIAANNQVKTSLNDLKLAMGLPAEAPVKLADALSRPALPTDTEDLKQQAYLHRTDVQRLVALRESARLNMKVSQIQAGPVLTLSGTTDWGMHTNDVTGDSWQVQAGVAMPIFDAGLTRSRVDSNRAALDQADQALRQAELSISHDLDTNYATAVQTNAGIDAANASVEAARVNLAAQQERYLAGVATVIDVTDAEQSLRSAEANQVQSLYNYNTALAALSAAQGQSVVPGIDLTRLP